MAMWFAATGGFPRTERKRLLAFALLIPVCWAVVVLNVRAESFPGDPVRFDWRLLLPSFISAWIVSGAFSNNAGTRSLLRTLVVPRKPAWCAIALVSLPAFMIATVIFGYALGLPVIRPIPGISNGALMVLIPVRFLHYLLFVAVYEEPGWRGFLLPRLQSRFSLLMATVALWTAWAVWHLPLDFTRPGGWTMSGILQQRGPTLLVVSILITWLYNRAEGALLSPVLFHAAMGTFPFVLPAAPALLPLIVVWAIVVMITDRMWRYRQASASGT